MKAKKWLVGIILAIGVIAVSTSSIFIRLCLEATQEKGMGFSLFIAASRLTIAAIILLPINRRRSWPQGSKTAYYYGVAAGFCLALHFATWITSLSFTSIAASTTLVTTNPIWITLISWLWFKEKPKKVTVIGITIALLGGIFIACSSGTNPQMAIHHIYGCVLALFGAIMVSLYFLFGREAQRNGLSIGNYITVAYTSAALILFPLPLLFGSGYFGYPDIVYLWILLMAIVPQLIGHTSFNWAVTCISPTLVTLAILFEPVCSSILGFLLFGEIPGAFVLLGALILLIGVNLAVLGESLWGT